MRCPVRVINTGNLRLLSLTLQGSSVAAADGAQFVDGPSNCTIAELIPGEAASNCNATFTLTLADFESRWAALQVVAQADTVFEAVTAANGTSIYLDLGYAIKLDVMPEPYLRGRCQLPCVLPA